jgi:hypothetical protein
MVGRINLREGLKVLAKLRDGGGHSSSTVVAEIVDLKHRPVLAQASDYNRQMVCGEDVLPESL